MRPVLGLAKVISRCSSDMDQKLIGIIGATSAGACKTVSEITRDSKCGILKIKNPPFLEKGGFMYYGGRS